MTSPIHDRAVIDISATSIEHSLIADDNLAIHAISGADTVSSYYRIEKGKVLKVAQKSISLSSLGNHNCDLS